MIILPKLNFNFNDFNEYIDEETMYIHYNKHHLNYINKINFIFTKINFISYKDNINLLKNLDNYPKKFLYDIKNNLGGHINHSLFWKILGFSKNISKDFMLEINNSFINFNNFKKKFSNSSLNHFGSGWTWLIYNINKKLSIVSTSNQDNPIMFSKYTNVQYGYPLMCIDIWEHAYYLKYKNDKYNYIKSFWNIINWDYVSYRFNKAKNFNK